MHCLTLKHHVTTSDRGRTISGQTLGQIDPVIKHLATVVAQPGSPTSPKTISKLWKRSKTRCAEHKFCCYCPQPQAHTSPPPPEKLSEPPPRRFRAPLSRAKHRTVPCAIQQPTIHRPSPASLDMQHARRRRARDGAPRAARARNGSGSSSARVAARFVQTPTRTTRVVWRDWFAAGPQHKLAGSAENRKAPCRRRARRNVAAAACGITRGL